MVTHTGVDRLGVKRVQREVSTKLARERWLAGNVVPYRITLALDIRRLDGPGVDAACGVSEPAVDEWEAGLRYPTWEQLCALAVLTDFPVAFFVQPVHTPPLLPAQTSLVFHRLHGRPAPDTRVPAPVLAFHPQAVAARLGHARACPTCRRPR